MTETRSGGGVTRTPIHLWIVGILSLLWTGLGAFDYLATQLRLDFYLDRFTAEQLEYFEGFPAWAVSFWAVGVWGAFAGSLALLLRSRWAVWMFAISLVGLAGNTLYNFGLSNGMEVVGTGGAVFTLVIWVIAIALLLYSMRQAKAGVLR